jgi:hypothetical protein
LLFIFVASPRLPATPAAELAATVGASTAAALAASTAQAISSLLVFGLATSSSTLMHCGQLAR